MHNSGRVRSAVRYIPTTVRRFSLVGRGRHRLPLPYGQRSTPPPTELKKNSVNAVDCDRHRGFRALRSDTDVLDPLLSQMSNKSSPRRRSARRYDEDYEYYVPVRYYNKMKNEQGEDIEPQEASEPAAKRKRGSCCVF